MTTTTLDRPSEQTSCPTRVCLLYTISPEASWSNGRPVTSNDFLATVRAHRNPLAAVHDPAYDFVANTDVIDQRHLRVALSEPLGAWQGLFSRLIPADAPGLEPEVLASTGPFVFEDWIPGDRIIVERNDEWWPQTDPMTSHEPGTIRSIDFVFISDEDELIDALTSGEVDLASIRPTSEIMSRLSRLEETVDYRLAPGPFWEHVDFQHEDELLARPWVRKVFDLAIDRQEILDRTVRLLDPDAVALNNTMWMQNAGPYTSHFEDQYDPERAVQLLVDHGCSLERETYVCDGRPMSFVWLSTEGDADRQTILDVVGEDLATIGVEVIPDLRPPSEFASRNVLLGGSDVWQLANFSWRSGSDPSTRDGAYFCGQSDLNVNGYCSDEVEDLVRTAEATMDPLRRAAIYNEADLLYLSDLALIPLYQKPELLVWSAGIDGPTPNFTRSTELWNVASWTGTEHLVVALAAEPASLDPLSTADDSVNQVLSTMLYGAFGMDPSYTNVPVLVDSVEVIEG